MSKLKTDKEFKKEVYDLVKNEYTVIGTYTGCFEPILIRHNTCNSEFKMRPSNFLHGQRCPNEKNSRIAAKLRMSPSVFLKRVFDKFGDDYKIVTPYIAAKSKVTITHKVCGNTFESLPYDFLRRDIGCPICSEKHRISLRRKSQEKFENEVLKEGEGNYIVIGKYIRWNTPIKIKHKICGTEYMVAPNSFLNGRRCPECGRSNGEKILKDFFNSKGIKYVSPKIFSDLRDIRELHYDFWLPDYSVLIEYQGEQHYKPKKYFGGKNKYNKQVYHDKLKREYAKSHNIKLIELNYKYNKNKKDIYNNMNIQLGVIEGVSNQR